MQVDLEDDTFDITYDPVVVAPDTLLGAIKKLDYKPELVERTGSGRAESVVQVDLSKLPKELADIFAEAKEGSKTVLLQFSGPG